MTIEKNFEKRFLFLQKNNTNLAFGKMCGISEATVRYCRKGQIPSQKLLEKIASGNNVTVGWLLGITEDGGPASSESMNQRIGTAGNINSVGLKEGESRLAELHNIPVLGKVPAGIPDTLEENIETYIILPGAPPDCYALRVAGESMAPGIMHGDYVLFVINRDAIPGDIVVVNDEYGESMIKRLKKKAGEYFLVSDNPSYPTFQPNEHYRIMGVVVGGWRELKL